MRLPTATVPIPNRARPDRDSWRGDFSVRRVGFTARSVDRSQRKLEFSEWSVRHFRRGDFIGRARQLTFPADNRIGRRVSAIISAVDSTCETASLVHRADMRTGRLASRSGRPASSVGGSVGRSCATVRVGLLTRSSEFSVRSADRIRRTNGPSLRRDPWLALPTHRVIREDYPSLPEVDSTTRQD